MTLYAILEDPRQGKTHWREVETRTEAVAALIDMSEMLIGELPDQVDEMVQDLSRDNGPIRVKLPRGLLGRISVDIPLGEEV